MASTIGSPGGSRGYAISNSPSRDTDEIAVRDSKDRDGPVLRFTAHEWGAFLAGVRDGEFEPPNAAPTTPRRRRGFRPWQAR